MNGESLGEVVRDLEERLDMTDSERVREVGRKMAHLRD